MNYGWLVLWVHVCSLEAMYQEELGKLLAPGAMIFMSADWWRMRWFQESMVR